MKTRTMTVGDILEGARAPYSHMDEKDARLFYSTMNALLVYANERLHVIRPERLHERPNAPLMLYTHGGQVAEELWKNRRIVEDFVSDNPAGLSDEQLECASQWRHALRDMFTAVDANADRAIFMNRDRLFAVGASQDPADSHVHHIPSLMLLTLLPFKGGIVTDGKASSPTERPSTCRRGQRHGRSPSLPSSCATCAHCPSWRPQSSSWPTQVKSRTARTASLEASRRRSIVALQAGFSPSPRSAEHGP